MVKERTLPFPTVASSGRVLMFPDVTTVMVRRVRRDSAFLFHECPNTGSVGKYGCTRWSRKYSLQVVPNPATDPWTIKHFALTLTDSV